MASNSDIQFCIVWETERPYLCRSRRSSFFRMFGEEWYLKIWMPGEKDPSSKNIYYIGYVSLYRRLDEIKLKTAFSVYAACTVVTRDKVLKSPNSENQVTVLRAGAVLYTFLYPPDSNKSETSENWKVFCQLSSAEALQLQINNETIVNLSTEDDKNSSLASTEKCIQISSGFPRDSETLSLDFARMLKQEVYPDFKLNCEGRTFPVHRSILAVRSEVLATMIRNQMQENETASVDIVDLEVPVLDLLLKFIYSGKLEDLCEDTAAGLYEAAYNYAVHDLPTACSSWIINNLTQENCLSYLLAADNHSDPELKSSAASFIAQHTVVLKTAEWVEFSVDHPVLAIEVFNSYVLATSQ